MGVKLAIKGKIVQGATLGLVFWIAMLARAAVDPAENFDRLVYKDGDQLVGKWLGTKDGVIVFKSGKFGELRVPAADAVVIKGERTATTAGKSGQEPATKPAAASAKPATPTKPAPVVAKPAASAAKPAVAQGTPKQSAVERETERATAWDRFSPALLTAKVRNYFGPWHGRLAFSVDIVSDTADRDYQALEGTLKRKWKVDEMQLTARYDYNQTNNLVSTDLIRGSGSLRHDFNPRMFAHYRTSGEWNRASRRQGVPNDYVMLQQEVGVGYGVLTLPTRKFRVGVSENFFDVWNTKPTPDRISRVRESAFEEAELTLPWRISILQRGVWYLVRDDRDGWEGRFELNKKLTETLSTSIRHEIRRYNSAAGTVQDYERLKLMLGFDF